MLAADAERGACHGHERCFGQWHTKTQLTGKRGDELVLAEADGFADVFRLEGDGIRIEGAVDGDGARHDCVKGKSALPRTAKQNTKKCATHRA